MLTFTEACRELRVSPKTLRKIINAGDIPASKIGEGRWGGEYRIDEQAVTDYLKRNVVPVRTAS